MLSWKRGRYIGACLLFIPWCIRIIHVSSSTNVLSLLLLLLLSSLLLFGLWWPWPLTFKLIRARDQTCLSYELVANQFSDSRDIRQKSCFLSLVTLTFDLDIQTLLSGGPNTSSPWIWWKSVQRFPRYFRHKQKSHRQRPKQNLPQFTACGKYPSQQRYATTEIHTLNTRWRMDRWWPGEDEVTADVVNSDTGKCIHHSSRQKIIATITYNHRVSISQWRWGHRKLKS